jgi:glycosyltransferase involved in cell wall biosynthesis
VLALWSFEALAGVRLFLRCLRRRPDLIYVRHDIYTMVPGVVARLLRLPLIVEVNSAIPEELALWGRHSAQRVAVFCERFMLRNASVVLVLAEEHAHALSERTGTELSRIRIVPIGTHLPGPADSQKTRGDLGVSSETFLIGFAGNLSPVQGVDLLLNAFSELRIPNAVLWIVGAGTEQAMLQDRAKALGERVRFFGGVPRQDADHLLRACQLLVAPYSRCIYERIYSGGLLSSKVLTYLATDRPVLFSDVPGHLWIEMIGAGEAFDSERPSTLTALIQRWYDSWCEDGRPLADWPWESPGPGRQFVESGHTWEDSAAKLEEVLTNLFGT